MVSCAAKTREPTVSRVCEYTPMYKYKNTQIQIQLYIKIQNKHIQIHTNTGEEMAACEKYQIEYIFELFLFSWLVCTLLKSTFRKVCKRNKMYLIFVAIPGAVLYIDMILCAVFGGRQLLAVLIGAPCPHPTKRTQVKRKMVLRII